MWTYLDNYFNLKKSFVFYGSYHHEWHNQLVHVIFVPMIFTSALSIASRIPITETVNLSQPVAAFYALSFIVMEPVAGALYAPVIAGMQYIAQTILQPYLGLAIGINVIGWAAQILAHKFLEKRKPAFMEDPLQAIHSAVFFVWLEVLYALGFKSKEKAELDALIAERIARMDSEATEAKKTVPATA